MGGTGTGLNNTYAAGLNATSGFGTMDMTSENLIRHLENVLDQSRKETAETKMRLEK